MDFRTLDFNLNLCTSSNPPWVIGSRHRTGEPKPLVAHGLASPRVLRTEVLQLRVVRGIDPLGRRGRSVTGPMDVGRWTLGRPRMEVGLLTCTWIVEKVWSELLRYFADDTG